MTASHASTQERLRTALLQYPAAPSISAAVHTLGRPVRPAVEREPANSHALSVIAKLQACLDEETHALISSPGVDLGGFGARKGQALMELNRALPASTVPLPRAVAVALSVLRWSINENMRVLALHVTAVREISKLLTDAIRDEESDGTYSVGGHGRRSEF